MTQAGDVGARGRTLVAVVALGWIGVGLNGIGEGHTWWGVSGVVLGALYGSTWLWPGSVVDRFLSAPPVRRRRPTDR